MQKKQFNHEIFIHDILRKSSVESKYSVISDGFLVDWKQKLEWKDKFRYISLIIIYFIFFNIYFLYFYTVLLSVMYNFNLYKDCMGMF